MVVVGGVVVVVAGVVVVVTGDGVIGGVVTDVDEVVVVWGDVGGAVADAGGAVVGSVVEGEAGETVCSIDVGAGASAGTAPSPVPQLAAPSAPTVSSVSATEDRDITHPFSHASHTSSDLSIPPSSPGGKCRRGLGVAPARAGRRAESRQVLE